MQMRASVASSCASGAPIALWRRTSSNERNWPTKLLFELMGRGMLGARADLRIPSKTCFLGQSANPGKRARGFTQLNYRHMYHIK